MLLTLISDRQWNDGLPKNSVRKLAGSFSICKKLISLFAAILMAFVLSACVAKEDPTRAYGNQLGAIAYTVKPGDNLVLIAAETTRQRENWRRIADFNRIANPATIKVGQTIWIPNDLIPLNTKADGSRSVAGHPEAVVNSVKLPPSIKPVN